MSGSNRGRSTLAPSGRADTDPRVPQVDAFAPVASGVRCKASQPVAIAHYGAHHWRRPFNLGKRSWGSNSNRHWVTGSASSVGSSWLLRAMDHMMRLIAFSALMPRTSLPLRPRNHPRDRVRRASVCSSTAYSSTWPHKEALYSLKMN